MLWLAGVAALVMTPALAHGSSLGPFDLLTRHGLTRQPRSVVHNGQATDLITQMIPWTVVSWTQVHSGHLPLWNPYSALGSPLVFNWQSGAFSLPALVGYAVPLRLAFTVQVVATLVIAGTGVYVLGRVLRLGVMGSVVAGTIYELSGPIMGFLGWPIAGVMAWAGWWFAAAVLVVRGRHRLGGVSLLGVVFALAVYAGQPGTVVILLLALAVFLVVLVALEPSGGIGERRVVRVVRPVVDLAMASALGVALSAPLWLPGLQLLSRSVFRDVQRVNRGLPPQDLVNLLLQGYSGTPLARIGFFGVGAAAYVGVIGVVLAVAGFVARRGRPEVGALGAVAVSMAALAFVPPVLSVLNALPYRARWHEAVVLLGFALAVLAGVGADVIVRTPFDRRMRTWCAAGFGTAALVLLELWFLGRGLLPRQEARIRDESFIWPAVSIVVGLVLVGALGVARRRREDGAPTGRRTPVGRWVAVVLLACESSFLVGVGSQVFSSSSTFFATTPGVAALKRAVGASVVGFGARSCQSPPTLGILQEANAAYGIREFAAYDPVVPRTLFASWKSATSDPATTGVPVSVFCPVVRDADAAREFGVEFVLEPHGAPGPRGSTFVEDIEDEGLYRIAGAADATLVRDDGPDAPPPEAAGVTVPVTHASPSSWTVVANRRTPAVLRLRLTDVPGWHATIDGRPLPLEPFAGVMLQAQIPAGHHTVELRYWPTGFSVGLWLAAGGVAALVVAGGWVVVARRRRAAAVLRTSGGAPG